MKRLLIILTTIFLAAATMTARAQDNPKLSYQAVVRDNQNRLLTNSQVNVEINILKPDLAVQYTETFTAVPTNQNGLMSLLIGNRPSWDNVDWFKAKINVKITLPGDMGMVESVSDVSAVPLAISALYADSVNLGAVPQSDWDETNPAKCTFIKNKPNIPDTIKNQLADGNSVINHIVDTIADNHIQWATDTLISNRELRDTAGILRGLIHTATGDVGDLAMRVDNFNRHVCDSVKGCVTGWIADSMEVVRDSISDIRADMGNMNDDILDSIANVNNHVRDTIRTINTALNTRIDTTAAKSITRDNSLQANIDSTSQHIRSALVDTAKNLRDAINDINTNLCTTVMACDDIKTMRDSIQTNKNAIVANATAISDEITNRTAADNEIKDIVKADSTDIMKNVSDTATAIRALITGASGDINHKVDSLNKNLFDTLHIKYVTNTVLADTIKDVRDSISALRDSMTTNYVSNADLCDKVMDCADIKTMRDSIQTNAANIKADSIFFAGRVKNLSDSVKMNVQAIIDSSKNIRKEIKDTASTLRGLITDANKDVKALKDSVEHNYVSNTKLNDTLNHYINEVALTDSIITKSGLADTASAIRTFVTTNYVSNSDFCDKVKTECIPDVISQVAANTSKIASDSTAIMQHVSDTATAIRALITGAHGDVGKLNQKVDSLNNNLFDTLHIKYVTNTVLADTIKDVRDSISALRDSIAKNYVTNDALCEKIAPCISNLRDSVKNNAIAIHEDSTLFAGRIKNLSDSVKLNIKAIADSSKNIREEIKDTANVLRGLITNADNGVKALKDSVEHNYVSNTKLNDTLTHYINEVALTDSIITKSGLADTASAIRSALVDTAGSLRDAIDAINTSMCTTIMSCSGITTMQGNILTNTSNIAANATKIAEDSVLFADRIKNLSDSVKLNIKAIADSSKNIREEIKDTANVLRGLITNADNGVKALKDSVEHNYVSNTKLNDTLTHYINEVALTDSIITKSGLADTASAIRSALVDTAGSLRDAIDAINTSMCTTIMSCSGITTMQGNILTNTSNIAANATKIAEDSVLFADRIKNLSDSVKLNIKAIADSSKNIREEIKDTANVLRGLITNADNGVKALKDSVEHNYVSNTKLNDTLTHYINEVALTDSIITKSGLADTASAIRTALVDTAGNLRDAINAINTNMCTTIMDCQGIKDMKTKMHADSSTLATKIRQDSTAITAIIRQDSTTLTTKMRADSSALAQRIYNDSTALKGMIDTTSTNVRTALVDTAKDIRASIKEITDGLCTTIMDCQGIKDMKTKMHADSSTLATKIRQDSTAITAIIRQDSTTLTTKMRADSSALAQRIYNDSTALKGMIDTTSTNVRTALVDTAAAIRASLGSTSADLSSLETRFKADSANLKDNYTPTSGLATVATSGSYNNLIDKPTIPTVNDAALTIQKNGADVATFTANASSAVTANVNVYDGKLYIKFNGDTLGQFSADYKDTLAVNINLKQLSTRLILNENTVDTLDYVEDGLDTTGLVLSIPTGYTQVDTANMLIQFYRNGVYVADTKDGSDIVKFIGGKLYYYPALNDNKECKVGDRIQVVYWVK
ncbi:MAG: hypothetical protein MJZ72_08005 [Bacteroidales bacterium]|nr:hypothetical protein [Bacteroidales bacterium]